MDLQKPFKLSLPYSQKGHFSRSWGRRKHITMEGWSHTGTLVAYCHIDYADPTFGEIFAANDPSKEVLCVDP